MPSDTIEIQAAVCRGFGEPLSIETLRLDPPQDGEVRVRVLASSICHSDIIYMDGGWGGELPAVFGHEVAGVVTDIGPAARSGDLHAGDRVLVSLLRSCGRCECCEAGAPTQCVTEFAIDSAPRLADGRGRPVRAGLRVYGRFCRACHGIRADGQGMTAPTGSRPANLIDDEWVHGDTDGDIFLVIRNGVPPAYDMDAWEGRITDEEIWHIVNFLRNMAVRMAR